MDTMVGDHTTADAPIYTMPDPAQIADVKITNDYGDVDKESVSLGANYGNKYQIRWFNQTAHQVIVTIDFEYIGEGSKGSPVTVTLGAPKSPFPGEVFVIPPGVGVTSGPIREDLEGVHYFKYSVQAHKNTNDPTIIINR